MKNIAPVGCLLIKLHTLSVCTAEYPYQPYSRSAVHCYLIGGWANDQHRFLSRQGSLRCYQGNDGGINGIVPKDPFRCLKSPVVSNGDNDRRIANFQGGSPSLGIGMSSSNSL